MLMYWVDDPRVLLGLNASHDHPDGTDAGEDTGQEQADPGG